MKNGLVEPFRLDDRVALVTGGSKGLGRAMAEGLASTGAGVVIASRHLPQSQTVAETLHDEFGVEASALAVDVTNEAAVTAMVAEIEAKRGHLDILINRAGINIRGPIEELSEEDFRRVMETNVTGSWLCSRAVAPIMKRAGWGRIINMASALGLVGLANRTPYAASKGAVVQMTRALAVELAAHRITVNANCPGPFLSRQGPCQSRCQSRHGECFC